MKPRYEISIKWTQDLRNCPKDEEGILALARAALDEPIVFKQWSRDQAASWDYACYEFTVVFNTVVHVNDSSNPLEGG